MPAHGRGGHPFFAVHPNVGRRSHHRCMGCVFAVSFATWPRATQRLALVSRRGASRFPGLLGQSSGEPMLADARQAWLDAQQAGWGDPVGLHRPGRLAAQAMDQARVVAAAVGDRMRSSSPRPAYTQVRLPSLDWHWADGGVVPASSQQQSITPRCLRRPPRWRARGGASRS